MNMHIIIKKKVSRERKIFMALLVFLLLICILQITIGGSFSEPITYVYTDEDIDRGLTGNVDSSIVFIPKYRDLSEIRIMLPSQPESSNGGIELAIYSGDKVIYQGIQNYVGIAANYWVSFPVNLKLKCSRQYRLVLSNIDNDSNPQLYYTKSPEGILQPLVSYGYEPDLVMIDKLLCIAFMLIICAMLMYLVLWTNVFRVSAFLQALMRQRLNVQSIVNLLLVYWSLSLAELEVDVSFKIACMLLAFGSTIWVTNHCNEAKKYFCTRIQKVSILALSVFVAFGLVGNRVLLYPINMHMTLDKVFCFFITIIWVMPAVIMCLHVLDCIADKYIKDEHRNQTALIVINFIILMVGAVYYIRAFNPCISTPDTHHCMYYARNSIYMVSDGHPPFYILWLKLLLKINNTPQFVVLVQFGFFSYVYLKGMLLAYRRGLPGQWITVWTSLIVLNCGHMVLLTTIVKDIPYSICLVWLTVIIAYLLLDNCEKKWILYVELVVALVGTCYFRKNGIVPYIIVSIALIIKFRRCWKIWVSTGMALILVLIVKFPVYEHCLEVKKYPKGFQYIGLGQDILGVYYNGGQVTEDALNMVVILSDYGESTTYSPYWAYSSYYLNVPTVEFIKAYTETFVKNPILMSRAILCRMDNVWGVVLGKDNWATTRGHTATRDGAVGWLDSDGPKGMEDGPDSWNAYWASRNNSYITERLQEYVDFSLQNSILFAFSWNAGVWNQILAVCLISVLVFKKRDIFIVFIPWAAQVMSLALSTGWTEYRYSWSLALITIFIFMLTFTIKKEEGKNILERFGDRNE